MQDDIQVFWEGDTSKASPWVGFARARVNYLRGLGFEHFKTVYQVADGIEVHIKLHPAGDKVNIIAPESCPPVVFSGLLDTYKGKIHPPKHTPPYLITAQLKMEYRLPRYPGPTPKAKLMYGVRPVHADAILISGLSGDDIPSDSIGVDGAFYTVNNTDKVYQKEVGHWFLLDQDRSKRPLLTTRLPVEETVYESTDQLGYPVNPPTPSVEYSPFKEAYAKLLPTKFTGLMRKIVQATFATSAWVGFAPNPKTGSIAYPIGYKFGDSWGFVLQNKKYFLMHITKDAVYYVPSQVCVHSVLVGKAKQKAPILRRVFPDRKKKLCDLPTDIGGSWDTELGWAFSYDKAEAAIVYSSGTKAPTDYGERDFVTTSLLTLTFHFGTDGTPQSADLNRTPPKILYYDAYMSLPTHKGLFHIPTASPEGEFFNHTVDFGAHEPLHSPPQGYAANNLPVYVYYTEIGGQQLCTYNWARVPSKNDVRAAVPTQTVYYNIYGTAGIIATPSIVDSTALLAQGWYGTRAESGYDAYGFSVNGSAIPASVGAKNGLSTEYQRLGQVGYRGGAGMEYWRYTLFVGPNNDPTPSTPYSVDVAFNASINSPGAAIGQRIGEAYQVTATDTQVSGGGGTGVDCSLTLSVYDTECALIFTEAVTIADTKTTTVSSGWCMITNMDGPALFSYGTSATQHLDELMVSGDLSTMAFATCTNMSHSAPYKMYVPLANAHLLDGTLVPTVTEMYIASPYTASAALSQPIVQTVTARGVCPGSHTSYTFASDTTWYGGSQTTRATPASTVHTLTLYSGATAQAMVVGPLASELFKVHPIYRPTNSYPLAYIYMQAAFDPRNSIGHQGDIGSILVVKLGSSTYDVKNRLFGWIGVV